ncbi:MULTISPECIES: hypothetical protein [unclassified Nostoc]|uniref:hypothetical protein n=1 Tax=unclassified Nostoc TaxID=2593658 RepID=UPI002AD26D4F|nr:hypothetical protein [Nostoc sp. DedQUE03]MDZ7977489.1 hypothetical protein [Nostoc sp. DedQUE03]MDZ8047368.1 hypothetical protein [Nostoc sp. DedQUE02]
MLSTSLNIIYFMELSFLEGRIGGVIYFEDIKIGLIAVSEDYPATNVVKYSRFSEMIQLSAPQGNDYN